MYLWYFNKDTSRRKVYPIVFKQELLDIALQRFEDWLAHAQAGTLPDRQESFWSCPRCEYRDVCKPEVLTKIRGKSVNISKANLR
jgi:CRISPR/Cas system-associated exonuclease Cas4 (RecB family)